MNLDTEVFNQIVASRIQQYNLYTVTKWGLFHRCKASSVRSYSMVGA